MRKYLEPVPRGVVLLGIVVLAASYPLLRIGKAAAPMMASVMSDQRYSTDMKALRNRFNQDKGKVRLLLLLSPS